MVVNTNIAAQATAGQLSNSSRLLSQSLSRLSSGSKITSAADDAGGTAVSMRFDAQLGRNSAAINNVNNALSFAQTQDGYLQKIGNALDRMSELSIMSQDSTKTDSDRGLYNQEFQTLATYVHSALGNTFNGVSLFSATALKVTTDSEGGTMQMAGIASTYLPTSGTAPNPDPATTTFAQLNPGFTNATIAIQNPISAPGNFGRGFTASDTIAGATGWLNGILSTGSNGSATYNASTGQLSVTLNPGNKLFNVGGAGLQVLGLHTVDNTSGSSPATITSNLNFNVTTVAPDISTMSGAAAALTTVKSAINQLATDRAMVGASMTRLTYSADQMTALGQNLTAANSQIKDVDVAQESTQYARYNILMQAGTSMLAQANSLPQAMLKLLS